MRGTVAALLLFCAAAGAQIPDTDGGGISQIDVQAWLDNGSPTPADAGATYFITSTLDIDGAGAQTVDWNGATITNTGGLFTTAIEIDKPDGATTTMRDLTIAGNQRIEMGVYIKTGVLMGGVDVNDLYSTSLRAIAFRVDVNDTSDFSDFEIDDCGCDNIDVLGNGSVIDANGVAGCLWVRWYDTTPAIDLNFKNSTWTNVWGEDGDIIKTDTENGDYDHASRTIFTNMYMGGYQRRAAKFRSSGVEIYNSTIVSPSTSDPNIDNGGGFGVGALVFLIKFADNADNIKNIIVDGNTFEGAGGYEVENIIDNVDGIVWENNQHNASSIALNIRGGDVTIRNNTFDGNSNFGAPIAVWKDFLGYDSNGTVLIDNNTATQTAGSGADWPAFVHLAAESSDLDNFTISDNLVFSNNSGTDTNYGLLHITNEASTTVRDLTVTNNVVVKQGTGESDEILLIQEGFGGTNLFEDNKLLISGGTSPDLILLTGGTSGVTETNNTAHPLSYDYSGLGVGSNLVPTIPPVPSNGRRNSYFITFN